MESSDIVPLFRTISIASLFNRFYDATVRSRCQRNHVNHSPSAKNGIASSVFQLMLEITSVVDKASIGIAFARERQMFCLNHIFFQIVAHVFLLLPTHVFLTMH